MNQTLARTAAIPLTTATGMGAALRAWWGRMMEARHDRRRQANALDDLDLRALRDIGACEWRIEREMQRDRAEMQWRIDSQFRG